MSDSTSIFNLPKVTLVRREFTEEADWREALPREPLHVHSAYTGSMDAPEMSPAGGMRSTRSGKGAQLIASRPL